MTVGRLGVKNAVGAIIVSTIVGRLGVKLAVGESVVSMTAMFTDVNFVNIKPLPFFKIFCFGATK